MPITPAEAQERHTADRKKIFDRLCVRIDQSLILGRHSFSVPEHIDPEYLDEVIEAYRSSGWDVEKTATGTAITVLPK